MNKFLASLALVLLSCTTFSQTTKGYETVYIGGGYSEGGSTLTEGNVTSGGTIKADEALQVGERINLKLANPYIDLTQAEGDLGLRTLDFINEDNSMSFGVGDGTAFFTSGGNLRLVDSLAPEQDGFGNYFLYSTNALVDSLWANTPCSITMTPESGSGFANTATLTFNTIRYGYTNDEEENSLEVLYNTTDFPNNSNPRFELLYDLEYITEYCEFQISSTLSGTPVTATVVLDYDAGAGPNTFTIDHNYANTANITTVNIVRVSDNLVLYTNNTSGTVKDDPIEIAPSDGAWAGVIPLLDTPGALRIEMVTTTGTLQGTNNCNPTPRLSKFEYPLSDGETRIPFGVASFLASALTGGEELPENTQLADPTVVSFYIVNDNSPYVGLVGDFNDSECPGNTTSPSPEFLFEVSGTITANDVLLTESILTDEGKLVLGGDDSSITAAEASLDSIQSSSITTTELSTDELFLSEAKINGSILDNTQFVSPLGVEHNFAFSAGGASEAYTIQPIEVFTNGAFASNVASWAVTSTDLTSGQFAFVFNSGKANLSLANSVQLPVSVKGSVDGEYNAESYVKFKYQVTTPVKGKWLLKARAYYGQDDTAATYTTLETLNLSDIYVNAIEPTFAEVEAVVPVYQSATSNDDLIYFDFRLEQADAHYTSFDESQLVVSLDDVYLAQRFENQEPRNSVTVVNGDFATGDLTGWTATEVEDSPTVSLASNYLQVVLVLDGNDTEYTVEQDIALTPSEETFLTFDLSSALTETTLKNIQRNVFFDDVLQEGSNHNLDIYYGGELIKSFNSQELSEYGNTFTQVVIPINPSSPADDTLTFNFNGDSSYSATTRIQSFRIDNIAITYSEEMREDYSDESGKFNLLLDGSLNIANGNINFLPQIYESKFTVFSDASTTNNNGPILTLEAKELDGTARDDLRLRVLGDAFIEGNLSAESITGLASGTYVPTITAVANMSAITVGKFFYERNGSVVTVIGSFTATIALGFPTANITLPIASEFDGEEAANNQCYGTVFNYSEAGSIDVERYGTVNSPVDDSNVAQLYYPYDGLGGSVILRVEFTYLID